MYGPSFPKNDPGIIPLKRFCALRITSSMLGPEPLPPPLFDDPHGLLLLLSDQDMNKYFRFPIYIW